MWVGMCPGRTNAAKHTAIGRHVRGLERRAADDNTGKRYVFDVICALVLFVSFCADVCERDCVVRVPTCASVSLFSKVNAGICCTHAGTWCRQIKLFEKPGPSRVLGAMESTLRKEHLGKLRALASGYAMANINPNQINMMFGRDSAIFPVAALLRKEGHYLGGSTPSDTKEAMRLLKIQLREEVRQSAAHPISWGNLVFDGATAGIVGVASS